MICLPRHATRALAATALAGALLLALPAGAQAPQPGTDPSAATPPAGTSKPAARKRPVSPVDHVEARIADLHKRLRITPGQEEQWNAVAGIMRENARALDDILKARAQKVSTMTAIDDLHSYRDLSATHVQNVDRLLPAFEALYAAMSAEQKKNADAVFHDMPRRAHRGKRNS